MPGVPCCTQTAVLRAVQATDGAILSLCLCVLSAWWDLQCKCQQVQLPEIIRDVSSPLCTVSVHVMHKCLGEGATNAARCWVACTSHQADGWLRLPWPGCPSFQGTTTSIGTAYAATDTDLSGTAWASDIDWEIPGESPWCIHMLACWHTHKHEKWGLGCPDKLPTSPALRCLSMGETWWPGRRWVDKWKVRVLSGEGARSPDFLSTRPRGGGVLGGQEACIYFKSLYPIYHHNLCSLAWGALRLGTEYVRGVRVHVCMGMRVWSSEGRRSSLPGED